MTDSVVPLSWVRRCQSDPMTAAIEGAWSRNTPVELGVDVGAGGDRTVIYARYGARAELVWRGQTPDPTIVVGQVIQAIRETGASAVKVDKIGIGWGVEGRLRELGEQGAHNARIIGVNVGEGPRDPIRFVKRSDEIWWEVGRELSRTQGWDLRGVDETTVGQLIAPKYAPDSAGRTKVERKEDTRARLGRSPDDADALLLAFYAPDSGPDPFFQYSTWKCERCEYLYPWVKGRVCPHCDAPAPPEDPYAGRYG